MHITNRNDSVLTLVFLYLSLKVTEIGYHENAKISNYGKDRTLL